MILLRNKRKDRAVKVGNRTTSTKIVTHVEVDLEKRTETEDRDS